MQTVVQNAKYKHFLKILSNIIPISILERTSYAKNSLEPKN